MALFLLSIAGWAPLSALGQTVDAQGPVPSPDETRLEAGYQFAKAKLLADAAEFDQALVAYERAVKLAPDDPYGWIEIAKLNNYLSQISRTRQQQVSYLETALANIEQARALEPDNIDALTLYAQTHMRLGNERPAALALAQGAYEKLNELQPENPSTLAALGQLYLWNRDGEKAVEVLSAATRLSSSNRLLQSMLVEALLGTGKNVEAESALERLIGLDPEDAEHRIRLAELRSDRGDHAGAVEALEGVAQDDWLSGARVKQLLAREYHLAGRHQDALILLDEHLASEASSSRSAVTLTEGHQRLRAAVLSSLLRYEEAIREIEPVVESNQDPERMLQDALLLSRLHERVGHFDEAIAVLESRRSVVPESSRTQLVLALAGVLERAERHDIALDTLARLSEGADARTQAISAQGQAEILASLDRFDDASRVLQATADRLRASGSVDLGHAVTLRQAMNELEAENWSRAMTLAEELASSKEDGLRSAARGLKIDILSGSGKVDEALRRLASEEGIDDRRRLAKRVEILFDNDRGPEAVKRITELDSKDDPESAFFASQLFQRHEAYAEAAGILQRLADHDSTGNSRILFALGAAQERMGSEGLAAETFQRLLSSDPDHAPTLNYLGYMWADAGIHLDRALEMIQKAVAQDPDNGAYVDSLGWVYFRLGRYQDAEPHLKWAARLEPSDPSVFFHLAEVYRKLGRTGPALDAYRRALGLGPEEAEEERIQAGIRGLEPESEPGSAEKGAQ